MEYLLIIVIAVVVSLLDDKIRGKKKVPPPTLPREIPKPKKKEQRARTGTFEIPPMRNVPRDSQTAADAEVFRAQEEMRAKWEEARRAEEQRKRRLRREEELRLAAEQTAAVTPARQHICAILPQLTPAAMRQAVVAAEVLGKPLALRKR